MTKCNYCKGSNADEIFEWKGENLAVHKKCYEQLKRYLNKFGEWW